jgi:18S rRNA (guanine1575-N7)-methyltransferase
MSSYRPESTTTASQYYQETAESYARNSRNEEIQTVMTERALELLALPREEGVTPLILDLGCGSGLSSATLNENGCIFIGMDLSSEMLTEGLEREVQVGGDFIQADMGLNATRAFKPGCFDGCVSISALQWLLQGEDSVKKLKSLFLGLHGILANGARAVFQFYPDPNYAESQIEKITAIAMKCGFGGGLVIDFPNSSKARKYYLVLSGSMRGFQGSNSASIAEEATQNQKTVKIASVNSLRKVKKGGPISKKEKVTAMKERQRRQGREVRKDTKYTGRERRGKF